MVTVAPVVVTPVAVTTVSESPAVSQNEVISHVESLFALFAKSLETKCSTIDECFSQVMVSCTSIDVNVRPNVSCQDMSNSSLLAPAPVAVCDEHPPARAPYAPFSEGLGMSREGLTTARSPAGISSLSQLAFADFVDRVRVYESSVGYIPDSYLTSLCSFVVYSDKFGVAISGNSLADCVRSFRQRLMDPNDPVPGTSQGGDSVVCFLCRLMVSSGSSPQSSLVIAGNIKGWGWLQGLGIFLHHHFRLLSPLHLRSLLSLHLLPPFFHLRFPSFSLPSLRLPLLFLLLRLLPLLRLLLLCLSSLLIPTALLLPLELRLRLLLLLFLFPSL